MFFAINPAIETLPAQIAEEFAALRDALHSAQPPTSLRLYALVDGAFDERFFSARYPRTVAPHSLYAETALQALGKAAPHLLAAPDGAHDLPRWLGHLFATAGGKPMLSVIASPLSADELARHMRPYLIAITPDTVQWPLRWGDTRVLPGLVEALSDSQRAHFFAPIRHWWSPGRDGDLLRSEGPGVLPAPAGFDLLPLSDESFFALVDAAEADSVLANLYDSQPELLQSPSPAEYHARVARHLALASMSGIHAAPARQHFSALAVSLADDFAQQPDMAQLLRRTRQGANYDDEIAALPEAFWRATQR